MKTGSGSALLVVVFLCLAVSGLGTPLQWPDGGIAVRQGSHIDWQGISARDADGNVLVVWSDMRSGQCLLYAQLLGYDGVPRWADGGVVVTAPPANLLNPVGTQDPAAVKVDDGWVVSWVDYRADRFGDVYAQKLNHEGQREWTADEGAGVLVDGSSGEVVPCSIHPTPDGQGGVILSWNGSQTGSGYGIHAQRINADGSLAWAAPICVVSNGLGVDFPAVTTDGVGDQLLAWLDSRNGWTQSIYAALIKPTGETAWGVNGTLVCDEPGARHSEVRIAPDGEGGCFVTANHWADSEYRVHVHRLSNTGNQLWGAEGVSLHFGSPGASETQPDVALSMNAGAADGCLIVWRHGENSDESSDVYAQKLSMSGELLWVSDGVRLGGCNWGDNDCQSFLPHGVSDLSGGVICEWIQNSNVCYGQMFAARVSADGSVAWGADGSVSVTPEDCSPLWFTSLFNDEHDGALVVYQPSNSSTSGLRFQRVDIASGTLTLPEEQTYVAPDVNGNTTALKLVAMSDHRMALLWQDPRAELDVGSQIYYQIVDTSGHFEKPVNGVPLTSDACPDGRIWHGFNACPDGSGGFFAIFNGPGTENSTEAIRLTHINASGELDWPEPSPLIRESERELTNGNVVADGAGGCYVMWDELSPEYYAYARVMRFGPTGQPLWDEPVQLTSGQTESNVANAVATADGGCLVTWFGELRMSLWAALVSAHGIVEWRDELALPSSPICDLCVVPDGHNGAYYSWDEGSGESALRVQHVTEGGTEAWTEGGLLVGDAGNHVYSGVISADLDGNLCVAWSSFNNPVLVQKLNASGLPVWLQAMEAQPDPVPAANLSVRADAHGGVFVAWSSGDGELTHVYGSHLAPDGQVVDADFWGQASGGRISGSEFYQQSPQVAEDGAGGWFVAWNDRRGTEDDPWSEIYVQRVVDDYLYSGAKDPHGIPNRFALNQNFPNPFNPTTVIGFDLPRTGAVTLRVYDLLGREVTTLVDGSLAAGSHRIAFDGTNVASGTYIYRIEAEGYTASRRMVMLK